MGNSALTSELNCCATQHGSNRRYEYSGMGEVRRQALIIFDWDDTLMCSSEIKSMKTPDPAEIRSLENMVAHVLKTSIRLGKTTIVTNANLCWVNATASLFMPSLLPILELIEVLSARQSYEEMFPNNPCAWKTHAFRDLISGPQKVASALSTCWDQDGVVSPQNSISSLDSGIGPNVGLNLVVLGDSSAEIQAGRSAVREHPDPDAILKTVKFKSLPTVNELIGQLQAVANDLERLVLEDRNMNQQLVKGNVSGWSLCDASEFQVTAPFFWEV